MPLPSRRRQPTPMSQWDPTARLSYWAFHANRRPSYMRFAYLQLGSDAAAEDAVDAAFDSIMNEWLRMLHMDRLDAYAWTILKQRLVDRQERRGGHGGRPSGPAAPEPMDISAFEAALKEARADQQYEVLTDTIRFYSAVSRLAERQRDAVLLRYGLQCTPGEAASVMGVDEATVRSQLGQAHRRLARMLDASAEPAGPTECAGPAECAGPTECADSAESPGSAESPES
ncbi:sigma-70 family RNA polymerase sigma factor [Streptomyces flavotricini]|uniref:Sigma-70 family RNA polymerase sigma factor n=1 Tax=Streptomyces flavotricini TaxID=66888 RepID=A0ABS8E1F6_9ACTN|nr:sigma-70 family RNA polymerase sigma factor [Streptomyces flavotricini]